MIDHRQLGVDLFNEAERLMERREDDGRMLHAGDEIADAEDREHFDEDYATLT